MGSSKTQNAFFVWWTPGTLSRASPGCLTSSISTKQHDLVEGNL
jgi:hypothetical protein